MDAEHFRWVCRLLWGDPGGSYWGAAAAAQFLGVTERNVSYFGGGGKEVPAGIARELGEELRRRLNDPLDETPSLTVIRHALALNGMVRGTMVG